MRIGMSTSLNSLFFFYHAGHDNEGEFLMVPTKTYPSNCGVPWRHIMANPRKMTGNVLAVIDACYGAAATDPNALLGNMRRIEFPTAYDDDGEAQGPGECSCTQIILDFLNQQADTSEVIIAFEIHTRMRKWMLAMRAMIRKFGPPPKEGKFAAECESYHRIERGRTGESWGDAGYELGFYETFAAVEEAMRLVKETVDERERLEAVERKESSLRNYGKTFWTSFRQEQRL
ncbi:uncharacterized protein LY89DRAFT_737973 [Mollisia scopiformis]|uniref:Uncharacterized protein n=1 Tax=Mollisia scopiformis TaxID=149040 RepID=A0A194WZN5_MOLSC|nr:uncharacterized protein LY89DRAFT_737973 [Mollisia scopiformis]KUJ13077.1 hypothetical protein LY89DRAFT_737973 [Mollisia scopiformis]